MKEISESLSSSRSTTCLCKLFASRHFCRSLHLVEKRRLANAAQCVLCTSETIFGYRVVVKTRLHSLVCWKGTRISTFQFFRRMRYNKQQRLRPRFARERLTPLETSHDNLHSDHSARYWSVKGIFRNIRSLLSSFLLGIMESQLRTIFCKTYLHLYMYIYVSYVDYNSMHCTLLALVSITQNQRIWNSVSWPSVFSFDKEKVRGRALIRFAEHPKVPTTLHNRSALHNDAAKFPKLVLIVLRKFEHSFIIYTCLVLSSHMVYILFQTVALQLYACICVHPSQKSVSALTQVWLQLRVLKKLQFCRLFLLRQICALYLCTWLLVLGSVEDAKPNFD